VGGATGTDVVDLDPIVDVHGEGSDHVRDERDRRRDPHERAVAQETPWIIPPASAYKLTEMLRRCKLKMKS